MTVQSILFDKSIWTNSNALLWLSEHNFHPLKKVHFTKNFLRYRIQNPDLFTHFFIKRIANGIELVIGIKS